MNIINSPPPISIAFGPLPSSRKVYHRGKRFPDLQMPVRAIDLHETSREEPVPVYDTSGPYTDPTFNPDNRHGDRESFGAEIPDFVTPEFVREEVALGRAIIPANINHPETEPMAYI